MPFAPGATDSGLYQSFGHLPLFFQSQSFSNKVSVDCGSTIKIYGCYCQFGVSRFEFHLFFSIFAIHIALAIELRHLIFKANTVIRCRRTRRVLLSINGGVSQP